MQVYASAVFNGDGVEIKHDDINKYPTNSEETISSSSSTTESGYCSNPDGAHV